MTTPDEAKRTAMAYAWGCEDTSGTATVTPPGANSGYWAFSDAYAQGQDDYNEQRRGDFLPVRYAYGNWQASGGRSVFKQGELTLDEAGRTELRGLWHDWVTSDNGHDAYYARKAELQDAAWNALAPVSL
jgi:hypothetical protein